MAYSSSQKMSKKEMKKKKVTKKDLTDDPPSPPATKAPPKPSKKTEGKILTPEQKEDLKKHMAEHSDVKDMDSMEKRSHRMKMMARMRKGMTIAEAHKDIV